MFKVSKFSRKPFFVDGVQVTTNNMEDVAKWCGGEIKSTQATDDKASEEFIKVPVRRALGERQTQAFLGDWVLFAGRGYKVYTPKGFEKCFDPVTDEEYVEQAVKKMTVND